MRRRKLSPALPFLAGVLLISAVYGQLLAPHRVLAERDIPVLHLPMLTDLVRLAGEGFPSWNPWIHGGQPLISNPHYAVYYPPVWLSALMPVYYAIGLLIVVHAAWAFWGTWRLAASWGCGPPAATLAAIGFVGGGAFVSSPNLLNLFMGFAWIPWALLWGDEALQKHAGREWLPAAAKTSLVLALQILTGSPEMAFISVLALACAAVDCLALGWRRPARLLPIGVLALALAAAQLLPTLRHLSESLRGPGLSRSMATMWSTPPARLAEWIWPRVFGDPMLRDANLYFGYLGIDQPIPLIIYIHCGLIILALAVGGLADRDLPRRRTLISLALLGVFLALGRYNPLYETVLLKIPPFSIIRFPEKFLVLSTTGFALAAALAWQHLLATRENSEIRPSLRVSLAVATTSLVLTLALYAAPLLAPDLAMRLLEGATAQKMQWFETASTDTLPPEVLAARAGYLGRETLICSLLWLATLVVLAIHSRRVSARWPGIALVLGLAILDLAYYGRTVNRTVPVALLAEPPVAVRRFPPTVGRVFSDAILMGNKEFLIPDLGAEVPPSIRRYLQRLDPYTANIWGYGYALEPDPDLMVSRWAHHALRVLNSRSGLHTEGFTPRVHRLLGAWNVAILVRTRSPKAQMEEKQRTGAMPEPVRIVPNPEVMERYRALPEVAFESDIADAVEKINRRDFRMQEFDAVLDPSRPDGSETRTYDPAVEWLQIRDRGSQLDFDYHVEGTAFLVAAVTMDRDWKALLDGSETKIYPTALGQMGIELPPGRHRLELRYQNPVILPGATLSLVALLGCCLVLALSRMHHVD